MLGPGAQVVFGESRSPMVNGVREKPTFAVGVLQGSQSLGSIGDKTSRWRDNRRSRLSDIPF